MWKNMLRNTFVNLRTFSALTRDSFKPSSKPQNILNNRLLLDPVCKSCPVFPLRLNFCDSVEDLDKKRKILELELDVCRQEGRRVPAFTSLKEVHWNELLKLKSRSARYKFYSFLWQIEKKKESKVLKEQERKTQLSIRKDAEKLEEEKNMHITYGLHNTTFLLRIYDTAVNHWDNNRLIQAMRFGQPLIFDCSYDQHMSSREATNAGKQLTLAFAENRVHREPFDLHFCNSNINGTTMKALKKHIPTLLDPEFPLNFHEKCFTEIFPKKRLVYLTPHCRTELENYSHDDIYIVGCMVDKINNEPLSLAKAKKMGLRMAKLPLDRYLEWGSGSGKSLTLNQMTSVLLDIKATNDWNIALKHVPRRKLWKEEERSALKERVKLTRRSQNLKFKVENWAVDKEQLEIKRS